MKPDEIPLVTPLVTAFKDITSLPEDDIPVSAVDSTVRP
jgi:hypothetical protein